MQRFARQSACLILFAVTLSAGSAANASILTTLPGGQINGPRAGQSIDRGNEADQDWLRIPECRNDVTHIRGEQSCQAKSESHSNTVTSLIDFRVADDAVRCMHVSRVQQALDQPVTHRLAVFSNLPPPVR